MRTALGWRLAVSVCIVELAACTPLTRQEPRLAASSLECMRSAVRQYVPDTSDDKLKHCIAAAFIARRCSVGEARVASFGKEFADIFDGGDPSAGDLHADAAGIECARSESSDAAIRACCGLAAAKVHQHEKARVQGGAPAR